MHKLMLSLSQTLTINLTINLSPSIPQSQFLSFPFLNPSKSLLSHHSTHQILNPIHCINPSQNPFQNPNSHETARQVISSLLQEFGAGEKDSVFIASNCPKYIEMIVESVGELEGLGLWGSWGNGLVGNEEGIEIGELGFDKKVYYMAKSKGDRGILPFLESLGVKLSTAKVIVAYLSSENLKELIDKVRYLKEVLYSNSGYYEQITGKNAKRMMLNLSVCVDEEIQSILSFFQKMEARHNGLSMLGNGNISFPCLVESYPKLLLRSIEFHFEPLVEFLTLIGVDSKCIASILLCFPPILFYDVEKTIRPRILAVEMVFERNEIGRILVKYPWILSPSILANYDELVALFKKEKVPKSAVDLAIKSWPHILGCSIRRIKLKLDQFNDLGVYKRKLVPIITSSPQLLLRKHNDFLEVVLFLEELGIDRLKIGKILCRYPNIFAANVENTLKKKINFLIEFGVSENQIHRVVRKYPESLLLDIDNTLLPRLEYFISIGLSKKEVCSMVHRFSPLLGYSTEIVIEPKLNFLLNIMRKPLHEIVEYPRYFSYCLEKTIKPRFYVIRSRNVECSLKDMLAKNDDVFAEEFLGFGHLLIMPPSKSPSVSLVKSSERKKEMKNLQ